VSSLTHEKPRTVGGITNQRDTLRPNGHLGFSLPAQSRFNKHGDVVAASPRLTQCLHLPLLDMVGAIFLCVGPGRSLVYSSQPRRPTRGSRGTRPPRRSRSRRPNIDIFLSVISPEDKMKNRGRDSNPPPPPPLPEGSVLCSFFLLSRE